MGLLLRPQIKPFRTKTFRLIANSLSACLAGLIFITLSQAVRCADYTVAALTSAIFIIMADTLQKINRVVADLITARPCLMWWQSTRLISRLILPFSTVQFVEGSMNKPIKYSSIWMKQKMACLVGWIRHCYALSWSPCFGKCQVNMKGTDEAFHSTHYIPPLYRNENCPRLRLEVVKVWSYPFFNTEYHLCLHCTFD